jgi:hypothetical protein
MGFRAGVKAQPMGGPFYNSETIEASRLMLKEYVIPAVLGKEISSAREIPELLEPIRRNEMSKAALETAVWHLESEARKKTLKPAPRRHAHRNPVRGIAGHSTYNRPASPDRGTRSRSRIPTHQAEKIKPGKDVEAAVALSIAHA